MFKFPKANNSSGFKSGNLQSQPKKNVYSEGKVASSLSKDDNDTKPKVDSSIRSNIVNKRTITMFEEMSNVSEERPEIISLSSFSPLYDEFGNKTESGKLFDVYIESLRQVDAATQKLFSEIQDKKYLKEKNDIFKSEITQVRQKLSEFNALIKTMSLASNNLNLHNKIYDFSPNKFVEKSFDDDDTNKTKKSNITAITSKLPDKLNLDIVINSVYGLPPNASTKYSSTKLWLLAVNELKRLLVSHSRKLLPPVKKPNVDETESFIPPDTTLRLSLPTFQASIGDTNVFVTKVKNAAPGNVVTPSIGMNVEPTGVPIPEAKQNMMIAMAKIDTLLKVVKDDPAKIAVIIDLIAKEIRYSSSFDQDSQSLKSFRGPGTQAINGKNFFDSIIGMGTTNYDVFKKSPDFATVNLSLSDMVYSRDFSNQNKAVLTLEEKESSHISSELTIGSKYFFDIEEIFTNIVGSRLNLSRVEYLQQTLSRLDNNFFNVTANFGLFPVDDESFDVAIKNPNDAQGGDGQPQKPSIISSNPYTLIENLLSLMVDDRGLSKTYTFNQDNTSVYSSEGYKFLQMDRGISALFSLAAKENDTGRMVRTYLMLIINDMVDQSSNIAIDNSFYEDLRNVKFQNNVDIENAIYNDRRNLTPWLDKLFADSFLKGGEDWGDGVGDGNTIRGIRQGLADLYENSKNADILFKYIPCKFYEKTDFSRVIRTNKFILDIVTAVRELRVVFARYAAKDGGTKSMFSGINLDNITMLFFSAICRMASQFSDNVVVSIGKDQMPLEATENELFNLNLVDDGWDAPDTIYQKNLDESDTSQLSWKDVLGITGLVPYGLTLYVNSDIVPRTLNRSVISSYVQGELTELLKLSLTVLNTLDVLNSTVKSLDAVLRKFNSNSMGPLLRYLNNDPRKLSLLLRDEQLLIALSTIEDVYQTFNDFNDDDKQTGEENNLFTNYVQNVHYYPKMTDIYDLMFKDNPELTSKKGYNKKIMTVGVPLGMFDRLLKKSSLNSKNSKHNDIFKISVYKTDVLNGEIIYRPKVFLFEASRFAARIYTDIRKTTGSDYREIFRVIPTRNYSLFVDGKSADSGNPTYWGDKTNAFGDEYTFLSSDEKDQIIQNHVMSYILENYMKIITGLSFDELTFTLDSREIQALVKLDPDPTILKQTEQAHSILINKSDAVIANARKLNVSLSSLKGLGLGGSNLGTVAKPAASTLPANLSEEDIRKLKSLSFGFGGKAGQPNIKPRSVKAAPFFKFNPDFYITRLMQPKKFDRVFNIIFDPEFEVDYEKTTATSIGSTKLRDLIRDKKIIEKRPNSNEYVDADKSPQNVSLENFMVVVETHAEEFKINVAAKGLLDKNKALQSKSILGTTLGAGAKNVYKK